MRCTSDSPVSQGASSGWVLTVDESQSDGCPVRTFGGPGRVRAVVAEVLHDRHARHLQSLHAGARDLFHQGIGAEESVDILEQEFPLRCDQSRPAVAAVTVLDLREDGTVDVASRFAPPVLLAGSLSSVWLLPSPLPGAGAKAAPVEHRGRLVATTGSFLGGLDPQLVGNLPHLATSVADPEALWSMLVGTQGRARGSAGLLIASRTAPATDASTVPVEPVPMMRSTHL